MTEIISPILFTKTRPLFSKINHYRKKYFVIQILVQMFNVFLRFVFVRIFCFNSYYLLFITHTGVQHDFRRVSVMEQELLITPH